MAILNKAKEENLASSILPGQQKKVYKQTDTSNTTKKRSFIMSTIDELKKSEWPNLPYVLRWSLVIIVFVTIFSSSLGYADKFYKSSYSLADCSAKVKKNETGDKYSDCFRNYFEKITLRQ